MLKADFAKRFKKDYKQIIKRGLDIQLLDIVIRDLINEKQLHVKYKEHELIGDYAGCMECHIKPAWLLISQIGNGQIVFDRTGSHSDLF